MRDPRARARVEAEFESIEDVLSLLPRPEMSSALSKLELVGVGALLHNFYNGVENILKVCVAARGLTVPTGSSWHRDLVNLCSGEGVLSISVARDLREYLAFRHFFSHGYAVELDPQRLEPLIARLEEVYRAFKASVERSLTAKPT